MSKTAIVLYSDTEGYYSGEDDNQQPIFTLNIERAYNFIDEIIPRPVEYIQLMSQSKYAARLKGIEILDTKFPEITSLHIQTHIIHG